MKKLRTPALRLILIGLCGLSMFLTLPAAQTDKAEGKVDINTASTAELQTLPRIGPKVAQRIIDFRKANGRFQRIEDIMKVRVSAKRYSRTSRTESRSEIHPRNTDPLSRTEILARNTIRPCESPRLPRGRISPAANRQNPSSCR